MISTTLSLRGTRRALAFGLCALLLVAGCNGDGRQVLTVYSPHGANQLRMFEQRFEEMYPEVDVQWMDLGSQEVLERVRSERANPQADVWFGAPSQLFAAAAEEGLLEPFEPSWAPAVQQYADPQGRYYGIYLTPSVIAFNSEAVDSAIAPRDWDDVLDPRWRGRVLIRDPMASGTMRSIFGMILQRSIRETGDTAAGYDWLRRLHLQTREYVLNPTLLYQKLARQEGVITLWNMPDIEELVARTGYPIAYRFPASGTPPVVDGVAVVGGTRNPEYARRFVEFVGSEEGMLLAAREFYRMPARTDLPADSLPAVLLRAQQELRPEPMDWQLLQERGAEWMRHWDEHVRGGG
jgi:iron(III) transport system substrate-binding protein